MGVLGEGIEIGGVTFPSIAAVINAYKGDSDIHLLQTPQIMTTDNEEAEIVVAQNIPYLTRQDTSSTGNVDYSNYEYKDVGATLTITPQINQERFIRLEIYQEISQVVEELSTTGLPTTLKRTADTTVIVKDGQTIVIGGMVGEVLNRSESSVPCLGSIPGLGKLFQSFSTGTDETNLYVFITPHIVENPEEAREVYEEKKDKIDSIREGAIKMYKDHWKRSVKEDAEEEK
jgi:general secretion pathway protein D